MTIKETYNDFLNKLKSIYEGREAANITDWVFENITGLKRLERNANKNIEIEFSQEKKLEKYLEELLQHKPLQYVLHEAWFYKMKFFVNNHVLIPRPETEELVEWIVEDVRSTMFVQRTTAGDVRCKETSNIQIIDIGTGSGCMAISLKKQLANANVFAIDVSDEALMVAKKNAFDLDAQINFSSINFLEEDQWNSIDMFDVIVSNPPYIPETEKEKLAKNVTEFEPAIALFAPGNDPFIFYKKISTFAQSHLKTNGKIYVEVHEEYANEVQQIFMKYNFKTEIKKDIYGKERMIKAM